MKPDNRMPVRSVFIFVLAVLLSSSAPAAQSSGDATGGNAAVSEANGREATCTATRAPDAGSLSPTASPPQGSVTVARGTFLKAVLPDAVKLPRLAPNAWLEARIAQPVYSGDKMAIPAGRALRLQVESVEKVRQRERMLTKVGHAIYRAFDPFDSSTPAEYSIHLKQASIASPEGCQMPVSVSVLHAAKTTVVDGPTNRANAPAQKTKTKPHPSLLLVFDQDIAVRAPQEISTTAEANAAQPGPVQKRARAYMLKAISASKSREGDLFQARLAEPVTLGAKVFTEGTLLEGRVTRRVPPRMLSRAGVLHLQIDRILPQDGDATRVSTTLAEAEADSSSRFALDEEGTLRGRKPGVKAALVDIGYAYALGKVADDISETPIRAVAAGIGNAGVATTARYFGLGTAALFLLTRHGKDVKVPEYGEIQVEFGRLNKPSAP